ncbi:MAG: aldo/keto reductase [bacterium]|nr:aldo/keto reductase [bacterium]
MNYRLLGRTGLLVSEIGFGCASFWGMKIFSEKEGKALVHAAIDRGVTFFDTGSSYSGGNAEPRLGRALKESATKGDLIITTKAGTRIGSNGKLYKDFSPGWVRQSVENSLQNLGLDVLPLLQLHGPSLFHLTDDLMEMLAQLRKEGKIKHFSVNSFDTPVIEFVIKLPIFDAVMIDYNILRLEREALIKKLATAKIGILAGNALAGGFFNSSQFLIPRIRNIWYTLRALRYKRADIVSGYRYRFINHVENWTGSQVALAYVLRNPDIACAVLGTTQMAHLLENLSTSGRTLSDNIFKRIQST